MYKIVFILNFIFLAPLKASQIYYSGTKIFYLFHEQTKTIITPASTICVFVPNSTKPLKKEILTIYKNFFKNMVIPTSFFTANIPPKVSKPIFFVFDWTDRNEDDANLKNEAERFITGLAKLKKQFPNNKFLLFSVGRGSLLVNIATNSKNFATTVDALVQIDTPIYKTMYPSPSKCNLIFNIYNAIPYKYFFPTTHKKNPEKTYASTKKFKPFNILMIINNTQVPLFTLFTEPALLKSSLVGAQILYACKEATLLYPNYRNVWVSLSDQKPETHLSMGLIQNKNSYTNPTKKELAFNARHTKDYTDSWTKASPKQSATSIMRNTLTIPSRKKWRSQFSVYVRPLQKFAYQTA